MRILVTGGAGFIGAHLTERLLDIGHEVVVIDNLSTGYLKNLAEVQNNPAFEFIQEDIVTMDFMGDIVKDVDMVFHLAAAVGVELVVNDPVRTITTNVHGTEQVLKAVAEYDKRVVVASTSEVYGKSTKSTFSETDDLLIGCPTHSRWSYACSKLLDEFYVMAFHRAQNLKGTVVRFFNTVGPKQTGQYGMVVPRFVQCALNNEDLLVYGDGTQSRCFCHVFDTVRALLGLIDCPDSYGKIYNIGSHNKISIEGLAEQVISQLGSSSRVKKIPYDQAYEAGFEDMLHRAPNTKAVNDLLDWEAEFTLEQIISDVAVSMKAESAE
ncbi:MAG: SDR family NAD(P)-dependent oxidoreductase [Lentisphaerae bacterium]|nr:SDR family NAD(P)-dependent oxidoreductase [Lentisphaerota bacterium]MCP4101973.1 SDR family NAD(P)-dependent oxidoreductase [Lentisphaerota bacterium]